MEFGQYRIADHHQAHADSNMRRSPWLNVVPRTATMHCHRHLLVRQTAKTTNVAVPNY